MNGKTLHLHIGRHKTGTSSIQASLAAYRDLLLSRGILYPASLPVNQSGFFQIAYLPNPQELPFHRSLGHSRLKLKRQAKRRLLTFADELKAFDGNDVILSAEDACVFPLKAISNIKDSLDELVSPSRYSIIFYTRHPISRALSGIQQNVKGNRLTLEDARKFHLGGGGKRYAEIIQNYATVFGAKALSIRSFEDALLRSGDIVTDFFSMASIDLDGITPLRQNESIAAEIVYFLSWLYEGPGVSVVSPGQKRFNLRKFRVPLSDEERKLLYGLKGAKANFLSVKDIDTLWRVVEVDMVFLEECHGIAYRKADVTPQDNSKLFAPGFMMQVEAMLPRLSVQLRNEFKQFLQTQGVTQL
jgi:hypothetical protein